MLILYKSKLVFVHIPKTGGCSVREHLKTSGPYCEMFGEHDTTGDLAHLVPSKINDMIHINLKEYTLFMITRNPYARLVSMWYYLRVKWRTFPEFVNFLNENDVNQWPVHAIPQVVFYEDGKEKCEFKQIMVLRFENLRVEYKALCAKCGIEGELPHQNQSRFTLKELDTMAHYDDKTLAIVNRLYEKDFEAFGYVQSVPPRICTL